MAGVAIAAMAMVIVLSVFNGFTEFTAERMSHFSAPLSVTPTSGKLIAAADSLVAVVEGVEGVSGAFPVIQERAFAVAGDRQMPLLLCGISTEGVTAGALRNLTIDGTPELLYEEEGLPNTAISSIGVANGLRAFPAIPVDVAVYEPRRHARINPANPYGAFRCDSVVVVAVYRIDQNEYDNEYMFVSLDFARNLLGYDSEATSIEVDVADGADIEQVGEEILRVVGSGYQVADSKEQQQDAFRMINVEKWITLLMLIFILVVATFNVLAIMSIMIIEKRGNSSVLVSMGATQGMISGAFGWLSMQITLIGGFIGVVLGVVLSMLQQCFGFIKLIADDPTKLSIEAYPVSVSAGDIVIVIGVVVGIGFLTSIVTRFLLHGKDRV